MEENINSVNAEQTGAVDQPQQTEQPSSTESVNGEVTTSQQTEKVQQTPDENAKFAQIRRDYEQRLTTEKQKAKDDFIASQGYVWNNKPITTEAEYNQALQEQSEQQRQEQLRQQGIDPNIVEDYIKNNPTVKWANDYMQNYQKEQAKQAQFLEFTQAYPNVKPEEIPQDVWQEFNKGTPLKIAYAIAENAKLKAELESFKQGSKTNEVNAKNASTSTGSVSGQGNLPTGFITKDVFEANKKDQNWLSQNYDLLKNSMNKW